MASLTVTRVAMPLMPSGCGRKLAVKAIGEADALRAKGEKDAAVDKCKAMYAASFRPRGRLG